MLTTIGISNNTAMRKTFNLIIIILTLSITACNNSGSDTASRTSTAKPPVTLTAISFGEMYQTVEFNTYSQYLKKEIIRSPITGYVEQITVSPGDDVGNQQTMAILQTQEARALSNTNLKNDSLLNFEGSVSVKAPTVGIVNTVNYHKGAFVQQGDQIMDMVALNSIVFIMNVPYENLNQISKGKKLTVVLSGGQEVTARVGNKLPVGNTASQVQSFILKPDSVFHIPENLNAMSKVNIHVKQNVQRIDKRAILSNETQTKRWVMKMINDSTAVKIAVRTDMESGNLVEIADPSFKESDSIVLEGHYGLPDTAYVKVIKK